MKKYKRRFSENAKSLSFKNAEEVITFIDSLYIPKRKPQSISKVEHSAIVGLKELVDEYKAAIFKMDQDWLALSILNKANAQLRLSLEDYTSTYTNEKNQSEIIHGKYATYKHSDTGSYKRFLENVADIEDFFSTLKGYHAIAVKGIIIEFVSSAEMKVPAKYRRGKGKIWINPLSKRVGNTKEGYGSLRYIVLHELGHRFLSTNRQTWNISDRDLITTKYSETSINTMADEEIFAELFALSHWKNKYPQYKEQISKFEKLLQY